MGKETFNNHHTLWERRQYERTDEPRALRHNKIMQVRMPIVDHNELHKDMQPLPVMSRELARYALEFIKVLPYSMEDMDKFLSVTDRFETLSRGIGKAALEAGMFMEHFDGQLQYMDNYEQKRT